MPTLVAFYLKEFSLRSDGEISNLYKFIFCLCLPFVSNTFYKARMFALSIAECTQSKQQITLLLEKITGATITFEEYTDSFMCGMTHMTDGSSTPIAYNIQESFGVEEDAIVTFNPVPNAGNLVVKLNSCTKEQFNSYANLLIPFYTNFKINYTL